LHKNIYFDLGRVHKLIEKAGKGLTNPFVCVIMSTETQTEGFKNPKQVER
jgi:hypothetical protein